MLVEVGDAAFDFVDEDGVEVAGVEAVSSGADEVGVDGASGVLGVLDQEAGAAQAGA